MRLKSSDGPISIHNVNDVLNSPKRINTLHNSNITSNLTTNSNLTFENSNRNAETTTDLTTNNIHSFHTLNNVHNEAVKVQWSKSAREKQLELSNNANNQQRNQYTNINNTLAASLRNTNQARRGKTTSVYSESSPDDSFFDYEEANQSASSVDTSPQDEERDFDISDSESISDESNLNKQRRHKTVIQRRGIVNPNYPGFQHFAHALDYTIKVSSDTDLTDDDYECELVGTENRPQFIEKSDDINNINNNNIEETEEFQIDKIDSVNRLDSVENIQKVFYDKPVLNLDCENLNQNFSESSSNNSTQVSDEDTIEKVPFQKFEVQLNIKAEEVTYKCAAFNEINIKNASNEAQPSSQELPDITSENIVGDFGREVEDEFGRIASENTSFFANTDPEDIQFDFKVSFEPSWERAVVQEIEEAIGKLTELLDFEPTANTYQYEPNTEEPFTKCQPVNQNHTEESEVTIDNELKEASISEHLDETPDEQPAEYIDFEPKPQEFKLEEIIEETLNRLSDCKENTPPVILQDSEIVQATMTTVVQDNKILEGIKDNADLKTKMAPTATGLTEKKGKIRDYEKMEVESEINELKRDSNRQLEEIECQIKKMKSDTTLSPKSEEEMEKFCKEDRTKEFKEKEVDTVVKRRERSDGVVRRRKDYNQQFGSLIQFPRKEGVGKHAANRRSVPAAKEKKKTHSDHLGSFDVYNIETAMPKIDMEAIELHLKAAREEERRRRTDREEIRRRLAMGPEDDYYSDRPGRKPSLQARLQSGMNLQICFMNEALSDTESPSSDSECPLTNPKQPKAQNKNVKEEKTTVPPQRPATLSIGEPLHQAHHEPTCENDFFTKQARLQTEARMALAQAKEMARMQMEIEKQRQKKSPITEMVRHSLEKVGIPFPEDKRRLSRQILTEMNVAQLQVIVNDLHTQIETLNENLVKFLMHRDDLHMEQDSMLVDIEDLTRYLSAKEQILKDQTGPASNNNATPPSPAPSSPLTVLNNSVKPHLHRIASLVKK
ncbi:general transcriptional corepressor trfA isoform X2 [Coccinella septempunctata]|nr:general transcriptional corepressor trfA isoform X2 [Coccinella septempunctata]